MAISIIPSSDIKIANVGANQTVTITFGRSNCCLVIGMRLPQIYFCRLYEYWNPNPMVITESIPDTFKITKVGNSKEIVMENKLAGAVTFIAIGATDLSYS